MVERQQVLAGQYFIVRRRGARRKCKQLPDS
jgi:hypothetical protein